MALYTWNDTVRVIATALAKARPGELASVVNIHERETRQGAYFDQFPDGAVYTIEFEDGSSVEVHESQLARDAFPGERGSAE